MAEIHDTQLSPWLRALQALKYRTQTPQEVENLTLMWNGKTHKHSLTPPVSTPSSSPHYCPRTSASENQSKIRRSLTPLLWIRKGPLDKLIGKRCTSLVSTSSVPLSHRWSLRRPLTTRNSSSHQCFLISETGKVPLIPLEAWVVQGSVSREGLGSGRQVELSLAKVDYRQSELLRL